LVAVIAAREDATATDDTPILAIDSWCLLLVQFSEGLQDVVHIDPVASRYFPQCRCRFNGAGV